MRIIDPILSELERESLTTGRVLQRVPVDRLSWTPHPKSMALGPLAWHLVAIPAFVQQMLQTAEFDIATAGPRPAPETFDSATLTGTFERNVAGVRDLLSTFDNERAKSPFTLRRGEQVMMEVPAIGIIRTILLNHSYHHRGQLSVYLRLLDVAVPAIYGPSADENPFA
jgi:uncharacterized damage-inducible protein DinB